MEAAIERQTMKKVYLRLLPFCFVLYFICYLDRVNIGFAALTMNKDLGLSAYIYGLGAGAFFWGYFLLEVPSNLILEKIGARRWIGRIMISWGIGFGRLCVHPRADQLLHPALHSGPCRGRLLSRHDPLFHLLVPTARIGRGSSPGSWRRSRYRSGSARRSRPRSSSLMAFSGSPAGNGCSSARRRRRSSSGSSASFT